MDYKKILKGLPNSSGVYIMKDRTGAVLYVGKAKDLKKRVSTYFQASRNIPERIKSMVSQAVDISCIPTSSEAEALIYENSLIKQLSPKYNIDLKDGKSYPLLKLTVNERFPRLSVTRKKPDDGALYYGPYTSAKLLKEALAFLRPIFPLRTCNKMRRNVCLNYHIKQCLGPCEGKVKEEDYGAIVKEVKLFLEGKRSELLKLLSQNMSEASSSEDFEKAAAIRNRIDALSSIKSKRVIYNSRDAAKELAVFLGIEGPLDRIEAFDVSNIMGNYAVGSLIYFYRALPLKDNYRRFRIKTVSGIDDYEMIREIVRRRYKRLLEEKKKLPDLIVIDGGKGHVGSACDELNKIGLIDIPVIGIAKSFEHIYVKGKSEPVIIPKESKALHLLQRIRDEAHRFAIKYHKFLMRKGFLKGE